MKGMTEYQWRVLKRAIRERFDDPEHNPPVEGIYLPIEPEYARASTLQCVRLKIEYFVSRTISL